jgi:hypothetical protein
MTGHGAGRWRRPSGIMARVTGRPPLAAGRRRVLPERPRTLRGRLPALAGHHLGVLGRRVTTARLLTRVGGAGIDGATRPPPARRVLLALVAHVSPCRASSAILPDRESTHHGACQPCPPPGLARSSRKPASDRLLPGPRPDPRLAALPAVRDQTPGVVLATPIV